MIKIGVYVLYMVQLVKYDVH